MCVFYVHMVSQDECSFVSLRDVERAMIVFEFFVEHMGLFAPLINTKAQGALVKYVCSCICSMQTCIFAKQGEDSVLLDDITRAMIMSLSVCYHARLRQRGSFEDHICRYFKPPLGLSGGSEQFRNEIKW